MAELGVRLIMVLGHSQCGAVAAAIAHIDGTDSLPEVWSIGVQGRGFIFDTNFRPLVAHWDYDGLDLSFNGQTIFTDLPTPGFAPASGQTFAFSATTIGGGSQDTFIDDVLLVTSPAAPPCLGSA